MFQHGNRNMEALIEFCEEYVNGDLSDSSKLELTARKLNPCFMFLLR